jgi:hypothetical protein
MIKPWKRDMAPSVHGTAGSRHTRGQAYASSVTSSGDRGMMGAMRKGEGLLGTCGGTMGVSFFSSHTQRTGM